jgi:hypothetical protein
MRRLDDWEIIMGFVLVMLILSFIGRIYINYQDSNMIFRMQQQKNEFVLDSLKIVNEGKK